METVRPSSHRYVGRLIAYCSDLARSFPLAVSGQKKGRHAFIGTATLRIVSEATYDSASEPWICGLAG
jgi:hypothetical protein